MTDLTYENLSEVLVEALPELSPAFERELEWWADDKPGRHVIYGDLLNPYLRSALENHQTEVLQRVFALLEKLAAHEDRLVREVLAVTVLESIVGYEDLWNTAQTFMGRETRRIAEAVQVHWSEGSPLQL